MNSERSEEKIDLGKTFITYLPIITLLSFGIGILNQFVYYYSFHLNILLYTELNEITFNTLINIALALFFFICQQLAVEIFMFFRNRLLRIVDKNDERLNIKVSFKKANIIVAIISLSLTILFVVQLHIISNNLDLKFIKPELILMTCICYMFLLLLIFSNIYLRIIFITNYFRLINVNYIKFCNALMIVTVCTTCLSVNDAIQTKFWSTYGTYIELGTKKILSTTHYFYIGRTKNYVFFYDSKNDLTDIYQSKDITFISINTKGVAKSLTQEYNALKSDSTKKSKEIDTLRKKLSEIDLHR